MEFNSRSLAGRIDRIADEFDAALQRGETPVIEDYLRDCPPEEQSKLLEELLRIELEVRREGDAEITVDDYIARFTDETEVVRRVIGGDQQSGEPSLEATAVPASGDSTEPSIAGSSVGGALSALGEYEILEEIARGGMGVVYQARQTQLNRIVALKLIKSGELAGDEEVQRFRNEAEAAAQLDHPNIVPIYEVGEQDGRHFFSMGFVDGVGLDARIKEGPLPPREAAELIKTIAEAVQYAHDKGIVHRDLKPANVLIDNDGNPRITDFGLAKKVGEDSGMTATGQVMGTPSYMPPEQAEGKLEKIGPASDVYALGAMLYATLTGRPPFQAANVMETLKQVLEQDPVSPRVLNPAVDRDLETICVKCLEKEVGLRVESAEELAQELRRFLDGVPIRSRPTGRIARIWKWCRRRPVAAALSAAVVIAVVASVSAAYFVNRAAEIQTEADRVTQLSELDRELDSRLENVGLDAAFAADMNERIRRIQSLDVERGQAAQRRWNAALAKAIRSKILQARLSDEDAGKIRDAIARLDTNDSPSAETLSKELQSRLSSFQIVSRLVAPYSNAGDVFPARAFRPESDRLILRSPRAPISRLAQFYTLIPSEGDIEFDVVLAAGWSRASQVGVAIDSPRTPAKDVTGYRFSLKRAKRNSRKQTGKAQQTAENKRLLEIRRNGRLLRKQQIELTDAEIAASLRLRARRTGDLLTFQVNDRNPIHFEEMFRPSQTADAVYGLILPNGGAIQQLTARRRQTVRQPSPLQRGDTQFFAGKYEPALQSYRDQRETTNDPAVRLEADYKIGLCLVRLNRTAEAESVFGKFVSRTNKSNWRLRAACQLWLLQLKAKRFQEADATFAAISLNYEFEKLATTIPGQTLQEMVDVAVAFSPDGYNAIRKDSSQLRHIERIVTLLEYLEVNRKTLFNARIALSNGYRNHGKLERAFATARIVLSTAATRDEEAIALESLIQVAWSLKVGAAIVLPEIDKRLFDKNGTVVDFFHGLLVTRARIFASQGKIADAHATLDRYFSLKYKRWPPDHIAAHLVKGLLLRRDGKEAAAQQFWRDGFEYARKNKYSTPDVSVFLGALCGKLEQRDFEQILLNATPQQLGPMMQIVIKNRLLPLDLVVSTATNCWQRPEGRKLINEIFLGGERQGKQLDVELFFRFFSLEVARQLVLGTRGRKGELTKPQIKLVSTCASKMVKLYEARKLSESDVVLVFSTYKGVTGPFGWGLLRVRLPKEIRGPMAYLFGWHFLHQKRFTEAGMFFRQAAQDADAAEGLKPLATAAQRRLRKLQSDAAKGKPRSG